MAIIKWDPLGNIATLQDRINKLFDDSFPCQTDEDGETPLCEWTPGVDIFETDPGVVIAVDLPGVNKEDVVVEIRDDVLSISGVRCADPEYQATNYYRRERICGNFHRTFTLHAMVPPEQIKAKFKNGVLVVEIPRPEEDHPRQVSVDIE
ncbi:Hsp20/alpha crystallin family protein [Desulfosarcina alkanivorans]|jgi:HSP20 family protein|uniref:Hsp20/alpha crystallin family protein n=1 Tax=Desulfosarcina alkanivorans TaxID=571177 RepID=A0A5K7YT04_9BACT|nr:Hsp20/alpha crystallin family protein [Desulfosarcina alkanivorans]BBO69394.1 Hsp20/alpha crystallin family protein [Desulfosarcina alkanivorans]